MAASPAAVTLESAAKEEQPATATAVVDVYEPTKKLVHDMAQKLLKESMPANAEAQKEWAADKSMAIVEAAAVYLETALESGPERMKTLMRVLRTELQESLSHQSVRTVLQGAVDVAQPAVAAMIQAAKKGFSFSAVHETLEDAEDAVLQYADKTAEAFKDIKALLDKAFTDNQFKMTDLVQKVPQLMEIVEKHLGPALHGAKKAEALQKLLTAVTRTLPNAMQGQLQQMQTYLVPLASSVMRAFKGHIQLDITSAAEAVKLTKKWWRLCF